MTFLLFILVLSALAYLPQFLLGRRQDYRMAMRHGMAGGFIFTGIDHFVSTHGRYIPMIPDFLSVYSLQLVYFTGVAELAGAVGLIIPLAIYRRLGLPNLRKWAGTGLALMLVFLVIANIDVALKGSAVQGLEFDRWYYWLRPFFQPVFIIWALFVSGVIWNREEKET